MCAGARIMRIFQRSLGGNTALKSPSGHLQASDTLVLACFNKFIRMIWITILPILSIKINQNFNILMSLVSGKAQKVFIVFVSKRCLMKILKHILDLHLMNPIMIYWAWTSFYWEDQPHIFLYHWQMWKTNPLSRVPLSRTGRTPEWRLSIRGWRHWLQK